MFRLIKILLQMAKMVVLPDLANRLAAGFFILGKIIRFLFFFIFIFSIVSGSGGIAGYSRQEAILFFLIFNLIDITVQFLFRGVYHFRWAVVSGDYDLDLLKPIPSFFKPIFGHIDGLDLITLFPFVVFFVWFLIKNGFGNNFGNLCAFFILFLSSLLLGFSLHLLICAVCILTTEIDHLVWIYRDLTAAARFPTDIYRGFMRFLITFIIPVVLLITFPAKGLLGLLSWDKIVLSALFSIFSVIFSLKFWRYSLKRYASASS